jgi:MHS family shikimate/dehydroshikimate transporter-like MFS transporter
MGSSTTLATITRFDMVKVAIASVLGTTIEWYDFFIAATAASLVWPAVFYPSQEPAVGILLSFTTFGLGFVTRPIGAVLFGHFGDRLGRRGMLIWTLITMGIGTLGIAVTPSYAVIGIWGGILVTIFRLIQGLGVGGEWGGATSLLTEYAERHGSRWRVLWSVWVQEGVPFAFVAANATFLILLLFISRSDLINWAWRIPFYIGVLVIVIGVFIRYKIAESPLFTQIFQKKAIEKIPFASLMRNQWKTVLLLTGTWLYINSWGYLVPAFMQTYLTKFLSFPLTFALTSVIIATGINVFVLILAAYAGDKIGKKKLLIISALITAILSFPFFMLINTGNPALIILALVLMFNAANSGYAVIASFFSEQFPTKYRYSGVSFCYHLGGVLSGGLAPILASTMLVLYKGINAWPYIAAIGLTYTIISLITILAIKEKNKIEE